MLSAFRRRYHCNVDIGESAVKWKTIKELGIDMEKIELRYGHHTGAPPMKHFIARRCSKHCRARAAGARPAPLP